MLRPSVISLLLVLSGCGSGEEPGAQRAGAPTADLPGVEYDFGTIPHGEKRSHVFELDLPGGGEGYSPVGFRSGCTCGAAKYEIRQPDGTVRKLEGRPFAEHELRKGEQLLLEVTIDTNLKEPVDLPKVTTKGIASVQRVAKGEPRLTMPVTFHYAVDAPVEVRPRAHVDFGQLARSRAYSQVLELHPDGDAAVVFGPVETSDPRLQASLREEEGVTLVDLRFEPGEHSVIGPVRMLVAVHTNLGNGYTLNIPVSGEITPDIVVEPYARLGFGHFDFATATERFVTIHDYDLSRDPTFVVRSITDPNGVSVADHFHCRLEPLPGQPRGTKVVLRYLGNMQAKGFRGILKLAKPEGGPAVEIDFVGFHRPS